MGLLPEANSTSFGIEYRKDMVELVKVHDFNHGDYMWALDADELVNTPIRAFLKKFD